MVLAASAVRQRGAQGDAVGCVSARAGRFDIAYPFHRHTSCSSPSHA
ncbi:MAG: hypothetical protein AVDCRST_MAG13-560 [uncultured Solirubrobacteraceae bacterium]|uniref:Uncharacterized protein n=1 Tax=uncultured Solirubrobacteraceae bacterium TaxID=1162706 RepID=A0A6J4RF38_9ACTN|nr:MAG: hypothetical protein AVDCRST_MAG13-560 [uncultured Solirubrobacteraceae bacterium]